MANMSLTEKKNKLLFLLMVNYFTIHFPIAKHTATDISIFSLML